MTIRDKMFLALAVALAAGAQPTAELAAITHVEGVVFLNEAAVTAPGSLFKDATIRTGAGRAVIRLRRSGTLFLGENSSVRVTDNQPYNFNLLEVIDGSAVVNTGADAGKVVCEDTVSLSDRAVVRMDLHPIPGSPYGEHSCSIRVYEGAASAQLATVTAVLRAGKSMNLNRRAGDMIPSSDFDIAVLNDLDRWSAVWR